MDMKQVVKHYGSYAKAAVAIDKTVRCLEMWQRNGIPRMAQLALETLTKGALKADKK